MYIKDIRIILLLALSFFCYSCKQSQKNEQQISSSGQEEAPTTVIVTRINTIQQRGKLSLSGSIEAGTTADIGFMASGKVTRVTVEEGSSVKKGQLIASLDATSYQLNTNIANAALARTEDEYKRLTIMYNRGSLPRADYEKIVTGLQQAKAQQQLAAKTVRDTRLYSPISGIIARRSTDPGEIVGQGTPLFSIVEINPIKARVSVPETEIGQVKTGQSAQIFIAALQDTFPGKISSISPVADPASRAYTVKINLANPRMLIRPGMIAQATLSSSTQVQALVVLGEAVLHDNDQSTYVFIADQQRGKAFRRKITIGSIYNNNIEVTSGLNGGELVISGGQQKLSDGAAIQIKEIVQ